MEWRCTGTSFFRAMAATSLRDRRSSSQFVRGSILTTANQPATTKLAEDERGLARIRKPFICVYPRLMFVISIWCRCLNFLASRDHHIVAARVDFVLFQRPRRRPADVLSAQVVLPVMTGAPNLFGVVPVLHNALEVGTHG